MFDVVESQYTLSFLQDLIKSNEEQPNDILLVSLQNAMKSDGYQILQPTARHFLRSLGESGEYPHQSSSNLGLYIAMVLLCLICAGLASGLTQGLLSLDFMEMTIKSRSGTAEEKVNAAKVLPIIKDHHLLLVTLMLWNACATEALPIFLDKLVPAYLAVIISVTMVLLFGEILPASILTGPNQLIIAANLLPLVSFVMMLFYPVAWPIAKLLDRLIGHDSAMTMYNKTEITTMMSLQHEEGVRQSEIGGHGINMTDLVHKDEVQIIGGALKYREMKVSAVMTLADKAFMLSADDVLSNKTLYDIFKSGYSRIPVYDRDRNDIIGLVLAKDLIFVDAKDNTPVRNFVELFGRKPAVVWHDNKLGETLSMFRQERSHMAIVRDVVSKGLADPEYKVVGIITLEDIIEEIIQMEITDETDRQSDLIRSSTFREMDIDNLTKLMTNSKKDHNNHLQNRRKSAPAVSAAITSVTATDNAIATIDTTADTTTAPTVAFSNANTKNDVVITSQKSKKTTTSVVSESGYSGASEGEDGSGASSVETSERKKDHVETHNPMIKTNLEMDVGDEV